MREIKFRQWDKRNRRFHYFGFDLGVDSVFTSPENPNRENFPVSQYTGLKDSKGVEIYEGDIVLLYGYEYRGDGSYEPTLAVTKWNDYDHGFMFKIITEVGASHEVLMFEYTAEVIGSIDENPELLGESDEDNTRIT